MRKMIRLVLLCMLMGFGAAFAQQPRYTDGPYVFNTNDQQYVLYASGTAHKLTPHMMQMEPPTDRFTVYVDDPVIDSFEVRIHAPKPTVSVYEEPSKLFAVSDIEGNFEAFRKLLIAGDVINEKAAWTFGTGHLVLVGDFMDRGDQVTQCLWLVYELERQAELAGGKVHFVIGNHENMNLRGNDKYVRLKYTELARQMKSDHENMWGVHTVLGAWMRTKNTAVKIGNTLYVHGGISPEFLLENVNLDQLNSIAKKYYGQKHAREIREAYPVFSTSTGPLWYRGYFKNPIGQRQLNKITSFYDINHIVVGHTIQTKIKTYYKNKVIAIDTPHKKNLLQNKLEALLKQEGEFFVLCQSGKKKKLF